jgi:hypothetical protein
MKKKKQPFEKDHHDLSGYASVDFAGRVSFDAFASRLTGYNPERFEPVALRMFVQKGAPILTLYAVDKSKDGKEKGKLPVKKFKLKSDLAEVMSLIKRFDFTVTNGEYDISEMIVTNK